MKKEIKVLIEEYFAGSERALARLLTVVESGDDKSTEIIDKIFPKTGNARIIGVTGAPGSGKSTLVDSLASNYQEKGRKVAILAVDPSSPISGGAVLGDRIRMARASEQDGVFIRSVASRGAHGGLSSSIAALILLLDGFGFDDILVETVGVGQGEVDVVENVQTVLFVVVPGMGDEVQAMKAGVMEIADIYVLNKADASGADRLEKQLLENLNIAASSWVPPVVRTVATVGQGVEFLANEVDKHNLWLTNSKEAKQRDLRFLRSLLRSQISNLVINEISEFFATSKGVKKILADLSSRKSSLLTSANKILNFYKKNSNA